MHFKCNNPNWCEFSDYCKTPHTHSANLHLPTIAFALCVKYLYQNLIDRILSNLIPKFSNHVIRIGRGYFRATDRRGKERLVHRKISSCHKRRNFFKQSLPARVFSPPCCVLSPLILTHSAWMSTHPAVETGAPNWKIHPKKVYWSRSLFIIFAPPQKKIYTFTT